AALHLLISKQKFAELPKNYQAIVRSAAALANADAQAKYDAQNPAALKRLVAAGTQLRPFSQEILEACFKASSTVYTELSGKNAKFKKMHDAYMGFRNDQYLWWQVAEYNYDNFMIRQRARG
ncbi:MAG TPA: ABC transporter substrate-binding protein, partial [Beijerinckiaceae bacterium]